MVRKKGKKVQKSLIFRKIESTIKMNFGSLFIILALYVRVGGFLLPKLHSLKLVSILVSKGDFMAWSDAKTIIENKLQADNTNSETEVDGHRVRKRSLNELVQLEDLICTKEDEETNGDAPLRTAGFRVQAYNNGSGLI